MNHLEFTFHIKPFEGKDILIAELDQIGFDGFVEDNETLQAYIAEEQFKKDQLESLQILHSGNFSITYSFKSITEKNWNHEWESNYSPMLIADKCFIRAPFHEPLEHIPYDIIIEPKMSFGTAHHETTSLMIETLLSLEVKKKTLLDMGCGTGVLAILANKLGADKITAIDNDEWAYTNSIENKSRNNTENIDVQMGDASLLVNKKFDVILANINRNILLNDIPVYSSGLNQNGQLVVSGFFEEDLPVIRAKAEQSGLQFNSFSSKNKWVAAVFTKI